MAFVKIPIADVIYACENRYNAGDPGFCRSCGEEISNVEPDAQNYICECCGEPEVFGCEEFLFRPEWCEE